jgi:starch synthase
VYRDATTAGSARPEVFFVEVGGFFERPSIYGEEGGYADNHVRFAFFCAAALDWMREVVPESAVLHAHDWHAALAPVLLRHRRSDDPYSKRVSTVLTVHNAGYQGEFGPGALRELGLEDLTPGTVEWNRGVNFLRAGLSCADLVTTVSPTHAGELLTPLGGFGLHEVFVGLGERLKGILNGIDFSIWDPQTDPWIESNYCASDLSGKAACKRWLQRDYGLEERADLPLFATTSRLVEQKGFELLLSANLIPGVEAQWVFLGEGELRYKDALSRLRDSAPGRVACRFTFAEELEHKVLAGADYLLMPSLYEPCGLSQMRAQRYGAVPVVRRVGGLSDTVEDEVTGFVFGDYEPGSLKTAVHRALEAYRDRRAWEMLARAGMARDFSFEQGTREYEGAYARAAAARCSSRESVMP